VAGKTVVPGAGLARSSWDCLFFRDSLNFINPLCNATERKAPTRYALLPYSLCPPSSQAALSRQSRSFIRLRFFLRRVDFCSTCSFSARSCGGGFGCINIAGEELSETAAPAARWFDPSRNRTGHRWQASLSSVAAVVRKEFRYLTRNGFAFLALLMPPLLCSSSVSQFAGSTRPSRQSGLREMFFSGRDGLSHPHSMAPAYNSFAYEGRGIQTYFSAPLRFRDVFLGKNLVLVLVLDIGITLSIAMLACVWACLPSQARRYDCAMIFTIVVS